MAMVSFGSEFSDIALDEARCIIAKERRDIPDGEYIFLDSYCDGPNCDCRRVIINIVSKDAPGNILATINYGWESVEFYKEFLYSDDEEDATLAAAATLDSLNFQSDLAPAFLKIFKDTLTQSYVETLKSHYEMFKKAIRQKQTIKYGIRDRYGGKVGRNEPCPCGSGKKYKKCCGDKTIA